MAIETKTETTAPVIKMGAGALTALWTRAEDAGFEPARACTQPAFQLCTASFRGVRRDVLSAVRRGRERGRTSANDGN
jgi:hypothetical protein